MSRTQTIAQYNQAAPSSAQYWRHLRRGEWLVAASLSIIAGCSSSENRGSPAPQLTLGNYAVPIAGCEQFDYSGCDVTATECQQNAFDLIKCVRQTASGTMPPIHTLTNAGYQAQLLDQINSSDQTVTPQVENALVSLGLVKSGGLSASSQASLIASNIAAFYSPDTKDVTIIVPDAGLSPDTAHENTLTLAHEFVHALQDQEHDLNAFEKANSDTYDATLGARSVVEGEARLYETFLRVAFDGLAQSAVDLPLYFQNAADYSFSQHAKDSAFLVAPLIFPYDYGGRYNYFEHQAGGQANIDALFTTPPAGSLPYILSQSGIDPTAWSPVSNAPPSPVSGYSLLGDDSLGAWLTYQSAQAMTTRELPLDIYAGHWRGDHIWVYSDGTENKVALVWKVQWLTAGDASNFAALFGTTSSVRQARAIDTVSYVVTTSSTDLDAWLTAATASNQTPSPTPSPIAGTDGTSAEALTLARRILISPILR